MEGQPLYLKAYSTGRLADSSSSAWERLRECDLCPRRCGVDRLNEETGFCGIGSRAIVASFGPHFGEEGPISGRKGSGTIFFSGCNLSCLFCQNHDISQTITGREMGPEDLADTMLKLQGFGCHNINIVSPTHVVPQVLRALEEAVMKGLTVPIVYNTGGYDSIQTLSLLDGIIDIYMPDMKYSDPKVASRLSSAEDYPERNRAAVREMHRQVGDLELDEEGIAIKGLLLRHLVLPEGLAGTSSVVRFLADEISKETYMNIMSQYRPEHRAIDLSGLDRRPTSAEIEQAYDEARRVGLHRFDR
jgi:putative pyruvate formate lyase activating enzyme